MTAPGLTVEANVKFYGSFLVGESQTHPMLAGAWQLISVAAARRETIMRGGSAVGVSGSFDCVEIPLSRIPFSALCALIPVMQIKGAAIARAAAIQPAQ
ncbi:hypothetical protein EVAR_96985_1 [Eumeta japonica]|uniref:Uncharacterized protein n=1 Tax=Eumeta variegata TaxID=151549 RepID=A0A4C1VDR0_EUMVA|nr:hypothetical protein EVAR_96985_1 [Eumeta japonica]